MTECFKKCSHDYDRKIYSKGTNIKHRAIKIIDNISFGYDGSRIYRREIHRIRKNGAHIRDKIIVIAMHLRIS